VSRAGSAGACGIGKRALVSVPISVPRLDGRPDVLLASVARVSTVSPAPAVSRVLVVTAHPDDADFGTAGTVATWTDAGVSVTYCVVTDGQAGAVDPAMTRERLVDVRRQEQRSAAAHVGVEDVRFLGYVDGEVEPTRRLVGEVAALIREVRPQRMVIPSAERDYAHIQRSHPDHLATGKAALDAIYPAARNPFAFPGLLEQGLEPWTVPDTWLMAHPTSNHTVDVTATYDRKMAAILAHESQHEDPDTLSTRLREHLARVAREGGLPAGRLAEAFYVVPTG
jgi:LmbE family N-acetylglucosaminyl deacetylase